MHFGHKKFLVCFLINSLFPSSLFFPPSGMLFELPCRLNLVPEFKWLDVISKFVPTKTTDILVYT